MSIEESGGNRNREAGAGRLVDRFGRVKRKLRISITDRCNFRCVYCMPEEPRWQPKQALLSFEELHALAAIFVRRFGVGQIRLTGGEPLVRRGAVDFVAMLQDLRAQGLRRVSLSTNGVFLGRDARALLAAGLDDVNVSLDSLSPSRFAALTGGGELSRVLEGIESARKAELPIKVNAVVIRGRNEADIVSLTRWGYAESIPLRLIEFMPLDGRGLWSPAKVFSESEIVALLGREFEVARLPRNGDPATYYLLNGKYQLGIISTVSNPFCADCDRIRLTANGLLFACLFSPKGVDLRTWLRCGSEREAERLIVETVRNKPKGFIELGVQPERRITMNALGG
jgi:GTP 3',8-cyclase